MSQRTLPPPTPEQIADYRKRLSFHDWFYAYSDDSGAYRKGSQSYSGLVATRQLIDRSGEIWNELAPKEFKVSPMREI